MGIFLTGRVGLALTLYLALVALLAWRRPAFLFAPDGGWKAAGLETSAHRSVLGAAVLFPLLAVVSYYVACVAYAFV